MKTVQKNKVSKQGAKPKSLASLLMPMVVVLFGITVMMYPVLATHLTNYNQSQAAAYFAQQQEVTPVDQLAEVRKKAKMYNAKLASSTGLFADPWSKNGATDIDEVAYQEYLQVLDFGSAMARIVIPKIKVDLPVYHGTSDETLARGVGHLFGTHLPVGGVGTHAVVTGHTGLTHATLFDNLTDLKVGDTIYISTAGKNLKYEVFQTKVVLPEKTEELLPVGNKDLLTLITCTPYGVNTHRLLVQAQRVPVDKKEVKEVLAETYMPIPWWMWAIPVFVLVVLLGMTWWIRTMWRKMKQTKEQNDEVISNE